MPLYEYECENCGEVFEVMQKFVDEPLATHPKCGGKVHRLISAAALQFKGSGWYVNDYAKGGAGSAKSGDSGNGDSKKSDSPAGSSSASDSGSTASRDKKPADATSSSSETKTKTDSSSDKK